MEGGMAKKSRRTRRAQVAKSSKTVQPVKKSEVTPDGTPQRAIDFIQDYHYVYIDVRTLAIVTVVMIVVMFGLSFVV